MKEGDHLPIGMVCPVILSDHPALYLRNFMDRATSTLQASLNGLPLSSDSRLCKINYHTFCVHALT